MQIRRFLAFLIPVWSHSHMEKSSKTKTTCKKTMCFRVRGRNENSSCILSRSFMTPFTLAAFTNYQWQLLFSSTNNGQIELRTSKPRAVLTADFSILLSSISPFPFSCSELKFHAQNPRLPAMSSKIDFKTHQNSFPKSRKTAFSRNHPPV